MGKLEVIEQKVGIVTFHAADNFGSALQAYALEDVLRNMGYRPEIVNILYAKDMEQYKVFRKKIYKERPRAFLGDVLYFPWNIKRKRAFQRFRDRYLKISKKIYYACVDNPQELNDCYDAFICGSDQIWNINCTQAFVPEFFLEFVSDNKKKIAYAPSMPAKVPDKYYKRMRKDIERLDAVSVRESETIPYLINEVGIQKKILHTVDPTLLLDAENYIDSFHLKNRNENYIFVYFLDDKGNKQELVSYAAKIARERHLKIKYVSQRRISAFIGQKYCLGIGPEEFLDMVYNASYVITNSFHATVFSIHFQVPFCVFPRSGSQARMLELLNLLNLEKNLYSLGNIDWMESVSNGKTKKTIKKMAVDSLNFLQNSLE